MKASAVTRAGTAPAPAAMAVRPAPPQRREAPARAGGPLSRHKEPGAQAARAPAIVDEVLSSPGQPLDASARAHFEPRFNRDFAQVRIHSDHRAALSARAIDASAYTVGSRIVFGAGRLAPHTAEGRRLMAHELAHVAQPDGVGGSGAGRMIAPAHDPAEREASTLAAHASASGKGHAAPPRQKRSHGIHREEGEGADLNSALLARDYERAVRILEEQPDDMVRNALRPLPADTRAHLRTAANTLDPSGQSRVARMVDVVENTPAAAPTPASAPAASDIANLAKTEKLSRAWGFARETLGADVVREVQHLFSPESIAALVGFAILYIAAQATPAGWVADALALTTLTITAIFVGKALFDIVRDLIAFFSAINATSEAELRSSGAALSRALSRGFVAVVVALLTRGLKGKGGGTPYKGPPPTAMAELVTAEGLIVRVPVAAVQEIAATSKLQSMASYAVAVPPTGAGGGGGGGSGNSPPAPATGGGGPAPKPRGEEIWTELSKDLSLEPRGTGDARGGGAGGAARDARAGGLIGPKGEPGTVDAAVQTHSTAPAVRSEYGVTGADLESAHIGATSALRGAEGYSRSSALTTLLKPEWHAAFDNYWKNWAMAQRRAGRSTCSSFEFERIMIEAIDQIPKMPAATRGTLIWRLQMELQELGLRTQEATIELPYRNIKPATTP
ncbi:DUF4157 domain-containing protein [Ancylobacter sonchi]|uniref:eCIS core domain-containing protein n=1 Tax=Ancylobacter sonchi TaxID=1937790 RepID=UPI001BD46687|nr:DUF4157 domain-containing protein [Ancylobacter sonchi]MBS7533202.1 DUF4157 domain-containing protein [Ancylobacter sonchi]